MVFYAHSFSLSDDQLRRIATGQAVRLKHANLTGDDTVLLTKTQLNKVHKALQAGTGIQLTLSLVQLKHNAVQGSGRFSDFLSKVGDKAKSLLRPVGSLIYENVRDRLGQAGSSLAGKALDAVGSTVKKYAPVNVDRFVDAGVQLGQKHSQEQLEKLLEGISRTITGGCACKSVLGKGLFSAGRA